MAKKLKFPSPGDVKGKEELAMIDADRILAIYNQDHPEKPAQRISEKVKGYLDGVAQGCGWAGTAFVKDAMTGHHAGLMLVMPQQTIQVSMNIVAVQGKKGDAIDI